MFLNIRKYFLFFFSLLFASTFVLLSFALEYSNTNTKTQIIESDFYTAALEVYNEGLIKGDLFAAAKDVKNTGTIKGDLISASMNCFVSGKIEGDARVAVQLFEFNGSINKNINVFAQNVIFGEQSQGGGNVMVFAQEVKLYGKIKGNAKIYAQNLIIAGTIEGDVDVDVGAEGSISILPTANILGKLVYKSSKDIVIPPLAKISSIKRIHVAKVINENKNPIKIKAVIEEPKAFLEISTTSTILLYFGLGCLLLKLFPKSFREMDIILYKKPFKPLIYGIATLIIGMVFISLWILLLIISIWFSEPSVAFILGMITATFYTIIIYFSTLPISLWLGNIVLKNKDSMILSFGTGFAIISVLRIILDYSSQYSTIITLINYCLVLAIITFGVGCFTRATKKEVALILKMQKT